MYVWWKWNMYVWIDRYIYIFYYYVTSYQGTHFFHILFTISSHSAEFFWEERAKEEKDHILLMSVVLAVVWSQKMRSRRILFSYFFCESHCKASFVEFVFLLLLLLKVKKVKISSLTVRGSSIGEMVNGKNGKNECKEWNETFLWPWHGVRVYEESWWPLDHRSS